MTNLRINQGGHHSEPKFQKRENQLKRHLHKECGIYCYWKCRRHRFEQYTQHKTHVTGNCNTQHFEQVLNL